MGGEHCDFISDGDTISLISRSIRDDDDKYGYIEDRKIIYEKSYKNIRALIFEGRHEMLRNYAHTRIKEICFKEGLNDLQI